jgi:hypothetical protein
VKPKQLLLTVTALLATVALLAYASRRTHFQWQVLGQQVHHVRWLNIAFGMLLIYGAYVVRAARWTIFLRPTKRFSLLYLLGTQVIGFTAVALLGRVADLTRPYLVARRTKLPIALQIAIYTVERMFDASSMAIIFALALLLAPDRATLPHKQIAINVARTALLGSVVLIVFAVAIRLAGEALARIFETRLPHKLGAAVGSKVRSFREGLKAVSSPGALLQGAGLSLLMWVMISAAYVTTVRAFIGSPTLSAMTLGRSVILMAASMAGSVVPIPIVSWFAQVLALQQTMQQIFGVRPEPALACGAGLTFVTFLCVIPVGLIWSRFERISLKQVSEESEHEAEGITTGAQA